MIESDQLQVILDCIADDPTTAMITWQTLEKELNHAKKWEIEFRKKIFNQFFPAPKSGVNNHQLESNYLLKGTPTVNVKIDEELFPKIRAELAAINLDLNSFLRWKPDLGTGYSDLVKNEKVTGPTTEGNILRQMITTTPGAPKLEIVLPAKFQK